MTTETVKTEQSSDPLRLIDSVLGRRIDLERMIYAPTDEMGVVFLAGILSDKLGISHIEEIHSDSFPDAIGLVSDQRSNGWSSLKRVRIEFEYASSNFKLHKHPIEQCDLIICWVNDWPSCPIRVVELCKRFQSFTEEKTHKATVKNEFRTATIKLIEVHPDDWMEVIDSELKTFGERK